MGVGKEAEVWRSLGGEGLWKFTGKAETNILKCQGSMWSYFHYKCHFTFSHLSSSTTLEDILYEECILRES